MVNLVSTQNIVHSQRHTIMISSTTNTTTYTCFICTILLCFFIHCCSSKDSIRTGEIINGTDYLESPGKKFQMGFFSLEMESERRYVGIWYAMDPKTVVWVANRDTPLPDSFGVLTITDDGYLKVLDRNRDVYFDSRKVEQCPLMILRGSSWKALKLYDTGNAVLMDIDSDAVIWESFLHPADTFLPGMKMQPDLTLTSWKNATDPNLGSFRFQQEKDQYAIWNTQNSIYHWKSGSGATSNFDPDPMFIGVYYLLLKSTQPPYRTTYSRLLMNHTGNIQYYSWTDHDKQWVLEWQMPKGACGKFSTWSPGNFSTCSCLSGFEPIVPGDTSAGCKRKYDLSCTDNDKLTSVPMIKVENPTILFLDLKNESHCKTVFFKNCSYRAYSYTPAKEAAFRSGRPNGTNGCWIWDSDLATLQANGTHNISIRVSLGTNSVLQRDNSERWAIELLDPDQSRREDTEGIGVPGYMAPEYALEGFFSIKSDVFSFGVVVLEIISGKKNTGSPQLRQNLSLLGYAWSLWKEDMPFEVMDQRLVESSNSIEVLKCIIVGLLCVQEDPGDRPSMTNVVLMLAGDIASLPNPKQPAFVARKTLSSSSSSSYKPDQTMTLPEGR
ncbi:hypothetical protein L1987_38048 [Smallanthus sonchifolius]|uniref:Uncharacterized protein n=1 Tax=Smallanthus sonchifolius TaxID=185202 RepID=A0ACB9HIT8_9ASTR|nr:hypothetical protein L1987_38048 [Smallanthus sonchifolius]